MKQSYRIFSACILLVAATLLSCASQTPSAWQLRLQTEDPSALLPELERLASRYPDAPDWEVLALRALYRQSGSTAALCNRLADLHGFTLEIALPLSADSCYYDLGLAARKKRNAREMIRWFRRIDPAGLDTQQAMVVWPLMFRFYLNQGEQAQALRFGLLAAEAAPENPGIHLDLGRMYEKGGELQKAGSEYDLAAALKPGLAAAQEGVHRIQGIIEAKGIGQEGSLNTWKQAKKRNKIWSVEPMGKEMTMQRLEIAPGMAVAATGEISFVWHRMLRPKERSIGWMRKHVARLVADGGRCGWPKKELRFFLERDGVVRLPDDFAASRLGKCWKKRLRLGVDPELIGGYASFSFVRIRVAR